MTKQTTINFRLATSAARPAIVRFFNSIRDELYIKNNRAVADMCNMFFTHGGAMIGCNDNEVIAVVGYFLGDPSEAYADKSIGFIYVAGLDPRYRHTSAFRTGLFKTMAIFQAMGLREVRLHALATDVRLNAIYSSFMETCEPQTNLRGLACNLYRGSIEYVLATARSRQRNPRRFDATPAGRPMRVAAISV
jgi:hypothetical protein